MNVPDSPSRASYDEEERSLIRRQLLGYMERHKIGTPTLQARIAETTDRTLDEVNNKTLQRFLAGRHRTNDAFIWLCHKFLLGIDAEDPVREFGDAAGRFFQHEGEPRALTGAAGAYDIGFRFEDDEEYAPHSTLQLAPVKGRAFLRAAEAVIDPRSARRGDADNPLRFEGVAFAAGKGLTILSRDTLTRRQKWHVLYEAAAGGDGAFSGSVVTPTFTGSDTGANDVRQIEATRRKEAAP